jgi:non-specific serine/threonine protein kinase
LEAAVALYTDDFMAGFSLKDCREYDEWQFFQREELRTGLTNALIQLSSHYGEAGEYETALRYAWRWLELDGLNEAAHRKLMVLYAQNGQRTAAFRQYRECVRILDTELDVAPGPETDRIYQHIQAGELGGSKEELPTKPWFDRTARYNLPAELSSFIGRQEQIEQVENQVGTQRLVTLVGPGGVGKTRLALQAARALLPDFANGVWLVQLAPVADPAGVPGAIATALGLQESGEISLEVTLTSFLHAKRLLLVLDNCEHLVEASAQLAAHLLARCPDLHILASSREALGVPGEIPLRVAPLVLPEAEETDVDQLAQAEAVQLFVERAAETFPEFTFATHNALVVREICCRLDGIPLALELAARWVQTLPVEQVAERLDDAFRLLTGGQRTALPRQQTLRATLDWSYNLLSTTEKALLRRLAVFAGGWELVAAEAVCCGTGVEKVDVLQTLTQLVQKSLVEVARESGQQTRYHLLETIRQYALEKLRDADEMAAARGDHLRWFTALAERAEPQLYGQGQLRWLKKLEREHDNLRGALSWALGARDAETALQLSGALGRFWRIRSYWREGQRWLEATLTLDDETGEPVDPRWRARAYLGMGMVTGYTKDCITFFEMASHLFQKAGDRFGLIKAVAFLVILPWSMDNRSAWQGLIDESLAFFREVDNNSGIGLCLWALAVLKADYGDVQARYKLFERSLAHMRVAGDLESMGYLLSRLSWIVWDEGDLPRAWELVEEGLQVHRAIGSRRGICNALCNLAVTAAYQGDYDRALELAEEGVAIAREIGVGGLLGFCLGTLGQHGFFWRGEIEQAKNCLDESVRLARDIGHYFDLPQSLSRLGNIYRHQGNLTKAKKLLDESCQLLQREKFASELSRVQMYQGDLTRVQGDYIGAGACYRESLKTFSGRLPDVPSRLDGLGMVAALQDQPQRGVRLFGAAQALRDRMGIVIHSVDQPEYDQHLDLIRAALDESAFTAAWEAGSAMDADQAIAYALEKTKNQL